MAENENPFWTYSYALHESDGVGPACIGLQDRHGFDVNLLLYCCWVAATGRGALERDGLEKARGTVQQWQNQVSTPIREIRRLLKTESLGVPTDLAQTFRKELMSVELASERVAQDALLAIAPPPTDGDLETRSGVVRQNLVGYFKMMGVEPDDTDKAAIDLIADASLGPVQEKS